MIKMDDKGSGEMDLTIEKAINFGELAQFLSEQNKEKASHIGYCGEQVKEIHQTLNEDFIDENGDRNFLIVRNNMGDIIAAIGIDVDGTSGEVWGPFNQTSSLELQHQLFEQLLTQNPQIRTLQFFINVENKKQLQFMDQVNAKKTGEHLVLIVNKNNFEGVDQCKSKPYQPTDFHAFQQLHDLHFPNTHYDAKNIVDRLKNNGVLKVLKNELNELQGYAYYEINTEMGEASIEYIGISPKAQNQGLGTLLLREVLTEMFSYEQIEEIQLCVDNTNNQANHVYLKVGFQPKDILISYILVKD